MGGLLGSSAPMGVVPVPLHMQYKSTLMIGLLLRHTLFSHLSAPLKHTLYARVLSLPYLNSLEILGTPGWFCIGKGLNSTDRKKDEYLDIFG